MKNVRGSRCRGRELRLGPAVGGASAHVQYSHVAILELLKSRLASMDLFCNCPPVGQATGFSRRGRRRSAGRRRSPQGQQLQALSP